MKRILLAIVSLLAFPVFAFAVTTNQDVTLVLPTDSSNYTLQSGSTFTTLTVANTTFTFVLAAGESLTLIDTDKVNMKNDQNTKVECNTNDSRLLLSNPSGSSDLTVVITPSGTCSGTTTSDSGGSSGGGGGGGGGGSSTPPPPPPPAAVPPPVVAVAPPSATPATPPSAPAASTAALNITRLLSAGSQGSDVTALQAYLAGDPSLYPEGKITGYFGSLTVKAVQKFQEKYGIAKAGDPGYGTVGPKTRAKLSELTAMPAPATPAPATPAPAPETPVSPAAPAAPSGSLNLTRQLTVGSRGADVTALQTHLAADPELYPHQITGYYGMLTKEAIEKFQEKYGIAKAGDPGYGTVGPKTRAKLSELTAGAPAAPAPATPAPAPETPVSPAAPASSDAQVKQMQDQLKALQDQLKALQGM